MRVLRCAIRERNLSTQREVEDFLARFSEDDYNQALARLTAGSPSEQAQQLAYEAMMDAETDDHAVALAERALALDPGCLDARVILAEIRCGGHDGPLIEALYGIVRDAEAALDPQRFRGTDVWNELALRPYLRAKFRLGDALRASGHTEEAIEELEELLGLNPPDQQAAREPLLACYLALNRRKEARRLLEEFSFDESAVFHWGRVLERFLARSKAGALRELEAARRQNRHVEPYLAFRKKPPETFEGEFYVPGDSREALHCLYVMGTAWASHPAAIVWLRSAG